jgi:hypothetical protein
MKCAQNVATVGGGETKNTDKFSLENLTSWGHLVMYKEEH